MARLPLDDVSQRIYEDELKGKGDDKERGAKAGRKRAAQGLVQAMQPEEDSELDALDAGGGASSSDADIGGSGSDGRGSSGDDSASAESGDMDTDGGGAERAARDASMHSSSSDGGTSSVDSDLEGLPLASTQTGDKAARKGGKARQGKGEAITEAGADAQKLGLAFERVLGKSGQRGVLEGSKSVQKRAREEADAVAAAKRQRAERRERRKRGHAKVAPKGQNPERDTVEKGFVRLATKGVVQLFNAITSAQKARRDAEQAGAKGTAAVKETKSALLEALRPPVASGGSGWKVLQDGYTGHEGHTKLKDRDRPASPQADMHGELDDLEPSDDNDFADW